jgi:hypothetical protein
MLHKKGGNAKIFLVLILNYLFQIFLNQNCKLPGMRCKTILNF